MDISDLCMQETVTFVPFINIMVSVFTSSLLHTAFFGNASLIRSDWQAQALLFNSKCYPSSPFQVDLPDATTVLDNAWNDRATSHQHAGKAIAK
jgi:hypothetical protein